MIGRSQGTWQCIAHTREGATLPQELWQGIAAFLQQYGRHAGVVTMTLQFQEDMPEAQQGPQYQRPEQIQAIPGDGYAPASTPTPLRPGP